MEPRKTESSNKVTLANYVEIDKSQAFSMLFSFLPREGQAIEVDNKAVTKKSYLINFEEKTTKLDHNWKNLMTVGKAKECLNTDVQRQLKEVKKATNFRYLRFHGIFDDEMMVYGENELGDPEFNFLYTDKLLDFLQSIQVKPFVELGFMPSELAENPNETVFYKKSIVSKPKDMDKWNLLLKKFIVHYSKPFSRWCRKKFN